MSTRLYDSEANPEIFRPGGGPSLKISRTALGGGRAGIILSLGVGAHSYTFDREAWEAFSDITNAARHAVDDDEVTGIAHDSAKGVTAVVRADPYDEAPGPADLARREAAEIAVQVRAQIYERLASLEARVTTLAALETTRESAARDRGPENA